MPGGGRAAGPDRPGLSAGRRARRRPGHRAICRLRGDRARRARAARRGGADPTRSWRRSPERPSADRAERRARRPRHRPIRRQPVLHRGAASATSPAAQHRPGRCRALRDARAAGEPAQPRPVADRRDGRGAPPDAQGRERRRARVRGARPARRVSGARRRSTTCIDQLDTLRAADLVSLDREAEQAYLFKHVATQEVAYESLPFALRTMLHGRVGGDIEAADPDAIDQRLDLLAHHFWRSDDEGGSGRTCRGRPTPPGRRTPTRRRSGTWSASLPLLEGAERVTQTIVLAQVLHVTGDIPRAEAVVAEARRAGGRARRPSTWWRAATTPWPSRRAGWGGSTTRGRLLERAHEGFVAAGDRAGEADVLQVTGTVAAQRGDAGAGARALPREPGGSARSWATTRASRR